MTSRLSLPSGQVDLWYVFLEKTCHPQLLDRYRTLLPEDEAARERRFLAEKAQLQYLIGRVLMRTVLGQYHAGEPQSWVFSYNPHGKPSLRWPGEPRLEFNLSHTDGMAVLAVTRQEEIGVDVENIHRRADVLGLANRFFAPAEAVVLERLRPDEQQTRFLQFWTLKESFIKARGTGLAMPLDEFAFTLLPGQPPQIAFYGPDAESPDQWQFAQLRFRSRFQVALAVRQPASKQLAIRLWETVPLIWQSEGYALPDSAASIWDV